MDFQKVAKNNSKKWQIMGFLENDRVNDLIEKIDRIKLENEKIRELEEIVEKNSSELKSILITLDEISEQINKNTEEIREITLVVSHLLNEATSRDRIKELIIEILGEHI